MRRTGLSACLVAGFFLVFVTGSSVSSSSARICAENRAAAFQPVLRLQKPRLVLGEAIRFWVGVSPKDSTS